MGTCFLLRGALPRLRGRLGRNNRRSRYEGVMYRSVNTSFDQFTNTSRQGEKVVRLQRYAPVRHRDFTVPTDSASQARQRSPSALPFPNIPPEIAAIEFNHTGGIIGLSARAENGIAYSGNS
jgi:hypothetical protein